MFQKIINNQLTGDSVRLRIANGTFWTLLGSIIAQFAGILGSILSAKTLGTLGLGELGMVRSTVLTLGILSGTGLGMAVTKYVAEYRVVDLVKTGRMVGFFSNAAIYLGAIMMLICFVFAKNIAVSAMNAPQLFTTLRWASLLLLLNTLNGVQLGILSGLEKFKSVSILVFIDAMLNLLLIPFGALLYKVDGAIIGTAIAALIGVIIKNNLLRINLKRELIEVSYNGLFKEAPILWNYVLPTILVGLGTQLFEWLTRLILVNQQNGYAELGIFTVAFTWAQMVVFLPGQISGPILPIFSSLVGENNLKQLRQSVRQAQIIVVLAAIVSAIPMIFFAKFILRIYGSDFEKGNLMLLVLVCSYLICAVALITRSLFASVGRMWWQTLHTIIWGVLLLCCFFFLKSYGGLGLAFSYLISYTIFTIIQITTQIVYLKKFNKK